MTDYLLTHIHYPQEVGIKCDVTQLKVRRNLKHFFPIHYALRAQGKSNVYSFFQRFYVLKGQDSEKTSLAEKVSHTLHNNEFIELFFRSRKSLDFGTKMSGR